MELFTFFFILLNGRQGFFERNRTMFGLFLLYDSILLRSLHSLLDFYKYIN